VFRLLLRQLNVHTPERDYYVSTDHRLHVNLHPKPPLLVIIAHRFFTIAQA